MSRRQRSSRRCAGDRRQFLPVPVKLLLLFPQSPFRPERRAFGDLVCVGIEEVTVSDRRDVLAARADGESVMPPPRTEQRAPVRTKRHPGEKVEPGEERPGRLPDGVQVMLRVAGKPVDVRTAFAVDGFEVVIDDVGLRRAQDIKHGALIEKFIVVIEEARPSAAARGRNFHKSIAGDGRAITRGVVANKKGNLRRYAGNCPCDQLGTSDGNETGGNHRRGWG